MRKKIKNVYFNLAKEKDLLEFADRVDNFSDWVKDRIRQVLAGNKDEDLIRLVEKIVDERLRTMATTAMAPSPEQPDVSSKIRKMF